MSDLTPSERYARAEQRTQHPLTSAFAAAQRFDLDPFQWQGCTALEDGHSVLVAAPTGAGKTVVGEFAIHLAMLGDRDKAFYTTPMKALSNQKFRELVDVYGPDEVGLLTGDTNINGSARILVMTTEVLRNMLYADSPALRDLRFVVMDEVHYLADRFRGAVWEEVIIHLPKRVRMVALSATVSNAEEFGDWLDTVRGDTDVVVSETRPVPLEQHMRGRGDLLPLSDDRVGAGVAQVNRELLRLRSGGSGGYDGGRRPGDRRSGRGGRHGGGYGERGGGGRGRIRPPPGGPRPGGGAPRGGGAAPPPPASSAEISRPCTPIISDASASAVPISSFWEMLSANTRAATSSVISASSRGRASAVRPPAPTRSSSRILMFTS